MDSQPNHRILIVDDNRAIQTDFRRVLGVSPTAGLDQVEASLFGTPSTPVPAAHCYELTFATQGSEAVEAVEAALLVNKPFALAFVDMRMPPGYDGLETITRLWKLDPHLNVAICTAYSDRSWDQIIGRLGQSDQLLIVKKPFDIAEVSQVAFVMTRTWNARRTLELQMKSMLEQAEQRARQVRSAHLSTQAA